MSHHPASSIPFPATLAREALAARQRCERGRKLILWGWMAAMTGVTGYCRAIFLLGSDAELLDVVTRTGALGWISAALLLGGVALWLGGNLYYLREVLDTPSDPDAQR